MQDTETIHLLEHAAHELQNLRAERDRLAAQMEIVNVFRAALLGASQPQGYGVDVVWSLRKRAEVLRGVNAVEPKATAERIYNNEGDEIGGDSGGAQPDPATVRCASVP